MTDTRKRSDWKAVTLGYDELIVEPVDSSEGRYCLTIPQVQAIMSFAEMMAWPTRWFSDEGNDIDRDTVQAFSDDIIRRLMMTCCCDDQVVLHRTTSDDQLQISTDGGTTWTQDPNDPRATVPAVPPLVPPEGVDACCQAGANLLERYKSFQAAFAIALVEAAGILAIATAFVTIIATLLLDPGHATTLIPLIISTCVDFVGMSEETYNAAFTDDIWSKLLCSLIAACSDGQFTDDSIATLKADFSANYTGIPRNTFLIINTCLGSLGSNFAASFGGGNTDNCDDCDAPCDYTEWEVTDGTFVEKSKSHITVIARNGGDGHFYCSIRNPDINSCCCDVDFETLSGSNPNTIGYVPCGFENDNQDHMLFAYTGQSANCFAFKGDSAYTLKIFSTDFCE